MFAPRLLWIIMWFWLSASYTLPLFFPDSLYWVSAASVLVSVSLGLLFLFIWLVRPFSIQSSLAKWVCIYIGWVALASIFSPYVWENWLRTAGYFIAQASLILAILLGSRLLDVNNAFLLAGRAYVLGTILTTINLVLLGAEQSTRFGNDELLHPNSLGFLYATTLLFLLFSPLYRSVPLRIATIISFFMLLTLTFSKTSIIAVLSAVGVAIIFQRGWRKTVYALGILIVVGVSFWFLGDYIQEQTQTYLSNLYLVTTLTGRIVLWGWVVEMVSKRPWFGYGYATFRDIFSPYSSDLGFFSPTVQAHNAYLDALFTGGYPGLFLFCLVVFKVIVSLIAGVRKMKIKGPAWSSFLVAIAILILIRSITEGTLNLGRDFLILAGTAFLAEAWSLRKAKEALGRKISNV